MRRSTLAIKLEKIKNYYEKCSIGASGYPNSWFRNGIRELDDVKIVDEDYQIEAWFHNKTDRVTKSVKVIDGDVHTHLISMNLWENGKSVKYDRMELEKKFDSEFEHTASSDSE